MMYQLVFRGECAPGVDAPTARSNAMALFKATIDQVERMFSGQRVVIRNKLEQAQAQKYQAVMRKHGMVAYLEPMAEAPRVAAAPESEPEPAVGRERSPESAPAASKPARTPATSSESAHNQDPPRQSPVTVEPGDRPNVAGDRVDQILAGSSLQVSAAHDRLSEMVESEAPMFDHLDEWTLAPVGAQLVESRGEAPVATPDISHLSLVDDGASRQS